MRVIYFDPFLGASGDMIISSLIDLGVSVKYLEKSIASIGLRRLKIIVKEVKRQSIAAKQVEFRFESKLKVDRFVPVLARSLFSEYVKGNAIKIIRRILAAEAKVHRQRHPHLHELADLDTLIDTLGALLGIEYLKAEEVYTAKIKAGSGFVRTAHGYMPAFNFATAQLLEGMPVQFLPIDFELTTPTGAAIISSLAQPVDTFSFDRVLAIGYGAGSSEIDGYPNVLRTFLGETRSGLYDSVVRLETNLDDENPQVFDYLFGRLFEAGALDVHLVPTIQKKSRPGIVLNVLTSRSDVEKLLKIIFDETSTLGVRIASIERRILPRTVRRIKTRFGTVRYKVSKIGSKERVSLEYEDLKAIARRKNLPLALVRKELAELLSKVRDK